MIALALSGGAAKGSYQAGALVKLTELGVTFDTISGVSAGALNASMLATGQLPRLVQLWQKTRKRDILKHRGWVGATARWLVYKIGLGGSIMAVYNTDKLQELIVDQLRGRRVQIPFCVGVVDLASGRYFDMAYEEGHILSTEDCRMIYASAAVPAMFDPMRAENGLFVDGGVRNITPLAWTCRQEPDQVVIITTEPFGNFDEVRHIPQRDPADFRSIDAIGGRTLEILLNEIFREDIQRFLTVNDNVRQAKVAGITLTNLKGRPWQYFETTLIDPDQSLGDGMDYSIEAFQWRFEKGKEDAERAWQAFIA